MIKLNSIIIIEFGFRIIWRIMEISEGVICQGCNTLLDFHNSSDDTQPHSIIVNWEDKETGHKLEVSQLFLSDMVG